MHSSGSSREKIIARSTRFANHVLRGRKRLLHIHVRKNDASRTTNL